LFETPRALKSANQNMVITDFEEMTPKSNDDNESPAAETFEELFASEPNQMAPRIQR
jgi:hypothetical protein